MVSFVSKVSEVEASSFLNSLCFNVCAATCLVNKVIPSEIFEVNKFVVVFGITRTVYVV